MEVEMRINVTPTHLLPALKDPADPVFSFLETDTLFILAAHLKGYRKDKIKIDKNEDGTQISVSWEKEVPSFRKIGFIRVRMKDQVTKFGKVFSIPDGVVLDQIRAVFNEKESALRILMPKLIQQVDGAGAEEVKQEELVEGATSTLPVPGKVPEGEKPMTDGQEMKQGYTNLPQQKPAEREDHSKNEQEMKVKPADEVVESSTPRPPDEVKGSDERQTPRKNEQEMKVKPADEVVESSAPRLPDEVKDSDERQTPRKNEQEMERGKIDVEATDDEIVERSPPHESGEANEGVLKKQADESDQNPIKEEPEMEQGKKEIKETDEVVAKSPQHEPQEVEEAIFPEKKSSETENTRKNEPDMEKEKENIKATDEAVGRILPQHEGEETLALGVSLILDVEAYNAHEENVGVETHPSPQDPSTTIQEASQLKSEQESDTTKPLNPDHPEEIQGARNETDQSEIDPVIPPETPPKKFRLYSPCFFAGSAILISIVVLVIHFSRRSRRL